MEVGEEEVVGKLKMYDLYNFIYYSKNKDGSVILPNGIKCDNISELYDYICISYLATFHLLTENKIYPKDMIPSNIFIHWLNDTSYYNNQNIKDCKYIIYNAFINFIIYFIYIRIIKKVYKIFIIFKIL